MYAVEDESQGTEMAALSSQGPAVACDPVAAGDGSSAVAPPGVSDAPEDWRTRGLLETVEPGENDEILRLCRLVNTRLHEAARAQDLAALRALLDDGASPSELDWEGRTPLHLCVVLKLIEPFQMLLRAPGGPGVCDASNWPLLHAALLHGWQDGARAAIDAGASVNPPCRNEKHHYLYIYSFMNRYPDVKHSHFTYSFYQLPTDIAMESGDLEMFETILTAADRYGLVDRQNGFGKTALKTAIEKSNLPAIQALLKRRASVRKVSDLNDSALHVAVHDSDILKYFLDLDVDWTDVGSSLDTSGLAPLHEAVCAKNPESVRLLLNRFNNARVKTDPDEHTPLHYAAFRAIDEVAKIILDKDPKAINELNKEKDTPLLAAAKHNNRGMTALLLRNGADLSAQDKKGVTVVKLISDIFYDASNFFKLVFDKSIVNKKFFGDFEVHVNYKVLTNGKDMSQINVLEEFVRCGQSQALIHPLIESLVYLKWSIFLPLFYAIICVHTIFLVSFNTFVINVFEFKDMMNSTVENRTENSNETVETSGSDEFQGGGYWLLILFIYTSIFLLLLQEALFIHEKRHRYLFSLESLVKLSALLLCAATPPLVALAQGPGPRHVACAALLLAWLQAMFLVSRLPRWGYYVLIFGKVALNILKILVTVLFMVIAFAFCFKIQYHSTPPFDGPFAAFVKTLVMMSSEFDYEDLFGEDHDKELKDTTTRVIVRLLFMIFVIFVAIVLMNFMTGVAVSDINELNKVGNIRRVEKQVELLNSFDYLVYDGVLAKWLNKIFGDKRYLESMYTFRSNESKWYVKNQNGSEYSIQINSSKLYNAMMETAGENDNSAEVEKQSAADASYRSKLDALYDAIVGDHGDKGEEGKEVKRKEKDAVTLKKQINMLFADIEKLKRSNEDLNIKIGQLSSQSTDILTILREIAANKGAGTSNK